MRKTRIYVVVLVVALVVLALAAPMADAKRKVIPPNATPHGLTYSDWSAKWWQWALAIPEDKSPFFDETGADVAVGQTGHVWFLAGTMEFDWDGVARATRNVTVPRGRMLFFPIINGEMSPPEGPGMGIDTWPGLVDFTKGYIDAVTLAQLTVDGRDVPITGRYRVQTTEVEADAPTYTMPEGGVYIPFGVAPGTYPFFSDGYFVMLAPLSSGKHTIAFHGIAQGEGWMFETQVTYNVTVK